MTAIIALIASTVISVWAISAQQQANSAQQQTNKDQSKIIAEQWERERRQFADRVSWWIEADMIYVENRSSVQLRSVVLEAEVFEIQFGDIAPCRASAVKLGDLFAKDNPRKIWFSDPIGRWFKNSYGVMPTDELHDGTPALRDKFAWHRKGSHQSTDKLYPAAMQVIPNC